MHGAMHVVINSGDHWHFEIVPGEDLGRLVNVNMSFLPVIQNMIFHFIEVNTWRPTVNINNG